MGHLGQLTAALFATAGHTVHGYSLEYGATTVDELPAVGRGSSPILEDDRYDDVVIRARPIEADYHAVCVTVPYDGDRRRAEMAYVDQAARRVATTVREGDTVVLKSTVPPGTTAGRFYRTVSRSGKIPEQDFSLGYVPAGDPNLSTVERFRQSDRMVGGVGRDSSDVVTALYRSVCDGTVNVAPDTTTAEFGWLARLAKRDLEVAYANQLDRLANHYDVGVQEAIQLANGDEQTTIVDPGLAAGSADPEVGSLFLGQWSDDTALLRTVQQSNARMAQRVTTIVADTVGSLQDATVALLGVGRNQNIYGGKAVARRLDRELAVSGPVTDGGSKPGEVRLHDPIVDDSTASLVSLEQAVDDADAIVIGARREAFTELSPERLGTRVANRIVVDGVGVLNKNRWTDSGFRYVGV